MSYTLSIDPGINGGFALFDDDYNLIKFGVLNTSTHGFRKILLDCLDIADYQLQAILERPFLAQSSNDIIFINYGRLLANLELNNIKYWEIRSQQWQKYHNLKKTPENKKPSKNFVANLYPHMSFTKNVKAKTIHDGITDAICIGLFAKSYENNNLLE